MTSAGASQSSTKFIYLSETRNQKHFPVSGVNFAHPRLVVTKNRVPLESSMRQATGIPSLFRSLSMLQLVEGVTFVAAGVLHGE